MSLPSDANSPPKQKELIMTVTISRLYDSYSEASAAVANLEAAGVKHNDISILASNADNWYSADRKPATFPDRDLDGRMTGRKRPRPVRASAQLLEGPPDCWPGLA